jgi:2-amino-4-hydroxy-6-hydroxymethyldihydropteridine diphosphokinase
MTQPEHQVCLLLGSNIQPVKNLARGIDLLRQKITIVRLSSVWESPPAGTSGPDYLNLAVMAITPLEAGELKEEILRPLENQLGRVRTADKNAPRPIDLDIILFNNQLAEILPEFISPQGLPLAEIASELAKNTPIHLKPGVLIGI